MKKVSLVVIITLTAIIVFILGIYSQKVFNPPMTNTIVEQTDDDRAEEALITFLSSLYEKEYEAAAAVYGGNYDQLQDWNPDIEPTDLSALWKRGCEQNGLNCLEMRNTDFASQPDKNTFIFNVWFNNPDKITEFTSPYGGSMFPFTVIKTDQAQYFVTTMPVYTP